MAVVALLTDFGTRDYYVGAMKGTILSIAPSAVIVDITHDVPAQNISEASFTLQACYRDFPAGTIFVAVVDPGVGSGRQALLVEAEGYYFLAPDNGLLSFVLSDEAPTFALTNEQYFRAPVSKTFHGRDIFAPVAGHLSLGVSPEEFGEPVSDPVRIPERTPRNIDGGVEGEIIHIDRFGNLVTNVTTNALPASYSVEINGTVLEKRCRYYAEANKGELFSIAGSAGFLEISICGGSAAKELGARPGSSIVVRTGG
jgi:S-adenosylmethionine hydrolase